MQASIIRLILAALMQSEIACIPLLCMGEWSAPASNIATDGAEALMVSNGAHCLHSRSFESTTFSVGLRVDG